MTTQRKPSPLFLRLKASLEQALKHARGEVELKTTIIEIPDPPPAINKKGIVSLRTRLNYSQFDFARLLNVPTSTVRLWETGKRKPTGASLRLLQVYSERPEVVEHVVRSPAKPSLNGAAKKRVSAKV